MERVTAMNRMRKAIWGMGILLLLCGCGSKADPTMNLIQQKGTDAARVVERVLSRVEGFNPTIEIIETARKSMEGEAALQASAGNGEYPLDEATGLGQVPLMDEATAKAPKPPTSEASDGEVKSPIGEASDGVPKSPVGDASDGEVKSPTEEAPDGAPKSPAGEVSDGESKSPTGEATEGEPAPTIPDTADGQGQTQNLSQELADCINAKRTEQGLSCFSISEGLAGGADIRSEEAASSFSHTRPDGSKFYTVNEEAMAECLARTGTEATSEEIMDFFMTSDGGHRECIMDASLTKMGIGIYEKDGKITICMLFSE